MTTPIPDVIDHLAGIAAHSELDRLRARRPVTRENAQKSYSALFEPASTDDVSLAERFAVAVFVAELHGAAEAARFYTEKLDTVAEGVALSAFAKSAAAEAADRGPYGHYPAGPLSAENQDGPHYHVSSALQASASARLVAALEHAHLLVFHLRDADPAALRRLIEAGWSTTGIVTLSQLISFLAFQIRVIGGLKVLAAA